MFLAIELFSRPGKRVFGMISLELFQIFNSCLVWRNQVNVITEQNPYKHAKTKCKQAANAQNDQIWYWVPHRTVPVVLQVDYRDNDPCQTNPKKVGQKERLDQHVNHKPEVVLFADATANPGTMMVELLSAIVANVTMRGPWRSKDLLSEPDKFHRISDWECCRLCSIWTLSWTVRSPQLVKCCAWNLGVGFYRTSDFELSVQRTLEGIIPESEKQVSKRKKRLKIKRTPTPIIR